MSRSTRAVAATAAVALLGALPAPALAVADKSERSCSKAMKTKKANKKASSTPCAKSNRTSASIAGRKIK